MWLILIAIAIVIIVVIIGKLTLKGQVTFALCFYPCIPLYGFGNNNKILANYEQIKHGLL